MAFTWQLGRPSNPPTTTTHTPSPFQCYSSIPALLISKENKEEREAEAQSPPAPALSWGGWTTQRSTGQSLGTLDNTAALQGTTALRVDLAIELALKAHSKAVNLASEPKL